MKTHTFLIIALVALFSGCSSIPAYTAGEIHVTTSYPLVFTDQIDAVGIAKVTNADGTVTRKAGTLTHTTTAGGFTRTAVYKEVELVTKNENK